MSKTNSQIVNDLIQAVDDANLHALWEYQETIIDNHFKPGNQRKYRWPPVSRKYYLSKVKQGYPPQQLVRTGELRGSVVGQGNIKKSGNADYTIEFNSVPEYGEYQRTGAPPQKGPRDFLEPDQADQKQVEAEAQKFIDMSSTSPNKLNPKAHL